MDRYVLARWPLFFKVPSLNPVIIHFSSIFNSKVKSSQIEEVCKKIIGTEVAFYPHGDEHCALGGT